MSLARLTTLAAMVHLIWPRSDAGLGRLPADLRGPVNAASVGTAERAGRDTLTGRRLRPEVTRLIIRGAHAVTTGEIQRSIVTSASHCRGLALTPLCLLSKAPYLYQRYYLDRVELKRDVLRIRVLYWLRGYRLASVDTVVAPPGRTTAQVTFTIHEGPATRIASLVVTPDTLFSPRIMKRLVALRVGSPLDINKLDTSVTRLREHLWARGYGDAVVDSAVRVMDQPRDDSASRAAAAAGQIAAGTADVAITLSPRARTTVDTVTVTGNQRVSAQTIRHLIPLRPRGLFLPADVEHSQRALFQTNLFRSATVRVDSAPGKPDSAKVVIVNVAEAPPREANVGGGFTTADFLSLSSHFLDYNWVGGGRHLTLSGGLGNLFAHGFYSAFNNGYKEIPPEINPNSFLSPTWSLTADVTQPWFLAPENTLGLGVFIHRRIAPGVFIDDGGGGNASFTHDLGNRMHLSLRYRFEVSHVQAGDAYFCVDYGICDAATRDVLTARSRLSPLIVGAEVDHSNDPLNPTAGYVLRAEFQHASQYTASDFRYNRASVVVSLYRPVGRSVLAFNARAGIVAALSGTGAAIGDTSGSVLHPTARFYAGGAESVRGFGENQLGPTILTIPPNRLRGPADQCPTTTPIQNCPVNGVPYLTDAYFSPQPLGGRTLLTGTVEYRFPLYGQFGGALFVDAGVVGQGNLTSAISGTSAVTPGFGFRYYSIVGPIRVDIGLNPVTTDRLQVLTETSNGNIVVVQGPSGTPAAEAKRVYSFQGLLNRFSLHLSIGQAF
jgi:outer membrane protein insertion porin family